MDNFESNDDRVDAESSDSEIQFQMRICNPFTPEKLSWQLLQDRLISWGLLLLVFVVFSGSNNATDTMRVVWFTAVFVVVTFWMFTGMTSARIMREMPLIGQMIDEDMSRAESMIATAIARKPLQRPVRLLLYHHLAVLRHRQQAYIETALIASTVLAEIDRMSSGLGFGKRMIRPPVRTQLLLILIESHLFNRDLHGAYHALIEAHRGERLLIQTLQLTGLQTQYEIAAGYFDCTVAEAVHRVQMAELMPAPQAGALHGLLAVAAQKVGQISLAQWCRQRGELLCSKEQLECFDQSLVSFANLRSEAPSDAAVTDEVL